MANKNLFGSQAKHGAPTDTVNRAGGEAYSLPDRHALAQYVATGTLHGTYYASGQEQLNKVLDLASKASPMFVAQCAVYSREVAFMKDTPALLTAILTTSEKGRELFPKVFKRVIDNGKMLRNFVQIMRSGMVGRSSLGNLPRKMVREWLNSASSGYLFKASVGNDPSMADIIKMVHPKPVNDRQSQLFAYLIGKGDPPKFSLADKYEQFKRGETDQVPDVPFQMLAGLPRMNEDDEQCRNVWKSIAKNAGWTMTRMNLNTFTRHDVFNDPETVDVIVERIGNPNLINEARVFPYQILTSYLAYSHRESSRIDVTRALIDAMEESTKNVPDLGGKEVWVCPDTSGSMMSPVTGYRGAATSAAQCIHVAALVASVILRRNKNAKALPFDTEVRDVNLNPWDTVMTNAEKLSRLRGGGTSCSKPLQWINSRKLTGDLVVYISDNQSWCDPASHRSTSMYKEWLDFRSRNPFAKMVCIDVQPYDDVQNPPDKSIMHIGGFSDAVFDAIAKFAQSDAADWVEDIKNVDL